MPPAAAFILLLVALTGQMQAHTTYLRPLQYDPGLGDDMDILVFNGTFDESINALMREGVHAMAAAGPSGLYEISKEFWERREGGSKTWRGWNRLKYLLGGMDQSHTSIIHWSAKEAGAHVVAVQWIPGRVALDRAKFKEYLEEVGLSNEPISQSMPEGSDAIIKERYVKTAKTILEIGSSIEGPVTQPTGLVAEIVPLQNPLSLKAGNSLKVRLLLDGKPISGQILQAGTEQGIAGRGRGERRAFRSDSQGMIEIPLTDDGEWWLAFNHMRQANPGDEVDLVTFWSTLTFEI